MDAGFVGLGNMGQPMARNLLKAGHRVTVWNRTRARAEALVEEGAVVAATPAQAAAAGVVLSMVADDRTLESVTLAPQGILAGLPEGGVHVSSSTVGVDTAERLARAHAEAGRVFLSACVFGRPDAAAAGKLFVVAGGAREAIDRVRPLLDAFAQRVFVVGTEPQQANLVKLAGNFLITVVIEGLAEAGTLVAKAGVDRAKFFEFLVESLFGAPVFRNYGRILAEERFSPPGFALPLGLKDNRLLLQIGERLEVPLPFASTIHDRMLAALARGYGNLDWSAFARITMEEAGLRKESAPG